MLPPMRVLALGALLFGCRSEAPRSTCDGVSLEPRPADPAARGPWPVGARTASLGGTSVEIWYPARPGSEHGVEPARYDIRAALPGTEAAKISDADNPWQRCACHRELPLDDAHGPYPVVVFVHGTAAFRHQSLSLATHWASRGFVVISADHVGLRLTEVLGMVCGLGGRPQQLSRDLDAVFAAIAKPRAELDFLTNRIDATRVAVAGHSAGANVAAAASGRPGVRAVIAMAGTRAPDQPVPTLLMAGTRDRVVPLARTRAAFENAKGPRTWIALDGAGHLAFSDLCATRNAAGLDLLAVAKANEVCGAQLAGMLFDCAADHLDGARATQIIAHASTELLERTLQCRSTAAPRLPAPEVTREDKR